MKTRLSALQLKQREVPAWFGFMVDLPNPPPPGGTPPASSTPAVEIVELDGVAIVNAPDAAAATLLVNTALATLPTPGNTSVSPTGGNLLTPGGPACWISAPIPIEMPPLPDVNLGDSGTGLGPPTPAAPVEPLLGYFPLPTLPGGQPVKMPKP